MYDQPEGSDLVSPPVASLGSFHPAVRVWFERRFPDGPTPAQELGWPQVAAGRHTLIAAPTGSGKTLAGFLACIDDLYRCAEAGQDVEGATQVVYVSPLKALGVDIAQNLERPLREIAEIAAELGTAQPRLRVEVRNGDTPPSVRAAIVRNPPNFLVTTPESLYLMVTAERSRANLAQVRTVIVDEIHAVARDKRGSHLALTLERLARLPATPPQRVGLSATQRPMEALARLLVGSGGDRQGPDGAPDCAVVDLGHRRHLDLDLELPQDELGAVASAENMADILDRIASLVTEHKTTLIFVNTRRLAERIAHLLSERLGDEAVAAHHGSLSKDRRLRVESRLRGGDLRALVATVSLELGIDIGPVELVCQIGSPRSIATFLQRVGRSGHARAATPKGRIYPTTRDELVECVALLSAVRAGRLDTIVPVVAPLDILAQQIVAECAAQRWNENDLFSLIRRASPFADLDRSSYDEILELVAEGITTGRGKRAAYLHRDRVNGELVARRGARLAALTSGGAIPELGDYRVIAEPEETLVGTVNEDWAIESMAGDVFLLGSNSWRIRRVEPGTVRVVDAHGAPPSIPFWLGEAPARSDELSSAVSELMEQVAGSLTRGGAKLAVEELISASGVSTETATMTVSYLATAWGELGCLPTLGQVVIERFFDDSGGMQLIVHSPYGGRINRGLGLALRKRFCVSFDFELQAAASDDAVLLSLGPQHSFELESILKFLQPATVESVLRQAVIRSPLFAARWRWNLNRSLAVLRFRGGRRNPPPIQRMESDDLMAAIFPALAACQENATGPIEVPDHPLVNQTIYDCMHEAMDITGLRQLITGISSGEITARCVDVVEPSVLAHEILNGRPYTYLDDAPLEERRSRAVPLRRGLPLEATDLSLISPEALQRVTSEVAPHPRDPDELHDLLCGFVVCRPNTHWTDFYLDLENQRRAMSVSIRSDVLWCAVEQRPKVEVLFPDAQFSPDLTPPSALTDRLGELEQGQVAAEALRGHLEVSGPISAVRAASAIALDPDLLAVAAARLEHDGFLMRGRFDQSLEEDQICARRLLARMHHYSRQHLRSSVKAVNAAEFMRFLVAWQHVGRHRLSGERSLVEVVAQLQGFELAAGSWEKYILPARLAEYRGEWLDRMGHSGELAWGRLGLRPESPNADSSRPTRGTASRATPVSLMLRADLAWLLQAARNGANPTEPVAGSTFDVLEVLRNGGALFRPELARAARRLPAEVDEALWDGVARGLITADGFGALRALLSARGQLQHRRPAARRRLRSGTGLGVLHEGRWGLLATAYQIDEPDDLAEAVAEQLLARWGVVWKDLLARESLALPWRDILLALRRMEARGTARGGRFVAGFSGEQYAAPDAVDKLRQVAASEKDGELVRLSATDPLNLVGIILPGSRIPALGTNSVVLRDGVAVDSEPDHQSLAR